MSEKTVADAVLIGSELALQEWLKNHKKGEECNPIMAEFTNHRHKPVVLLTNAKSEYPFSVQRNGNGWYFKSQKEAFDCFYDLMHD